MTEQQLAELTAAQLLETRRKFLRSVIIAALGIISFFLVAVFVQFLTSKTGSLSQIGIVFQLWVSALASFWLVRKYSLWLTITPLSLGIFFTIVATSTQAGAISPLAFELLCLVVLLVSISGQRRYTIIMTGLAFIVGVIALNLPLLLATPSGVVNTQMVVRSLAAGSILCVIWLIADRQTQALETALLLTVQRASEAERAQAMAEQAQTETEQRNQELQRLLAMIQHLELPVISIGQGVLAVPLVGNLDSQRLDAIRARLLEMVASQRVHSVIIDVTSITIIDTSVAQGLLQTAQAVRLLGTQTIISGISAMVATTLVSLDIAFDDLYIVRDMAQGLAYIEAHRIS